MTVARGLERPAELAPNPGIAQRAPGMAAPPRPAVEPVPPSSWTEAFVGLPYIAGVGECGHRAALVWRRVFGFEVEAPSAFGDMDAAQVLIKAELAKPGWLPVFTPAEGDAVIMWKGSRLAHVGVWVDPGHVLHCTRAQGMVLTPTAGLAAQGFRVFGFFCHRTAWAKAA